jgi:hypothetical protein
MTALSPTAATDPPADAQPEPAPPAAASRAIDAIAPILVGVGAGIGAGLLARASSGYYQDPNELHGKLRATAHSGLPFLVGAIAATNRNGLGSPAAWRAGLLGAHIVHVPLVAQRLRGGGIRDMQIRATIPIGGTGYMLLAAQTALLLEPVVRPSPSERTAAWRSTIDHQLLRGYTFAITANFIKRRRPLPVYACLAALLSTGFAARRTTT